MYFVFCRLKELWSTQLERREWAHTPIMNISDTNKSDPASLWLADGRYIIIVFNYLWNKDSPFKWILLELLWISYSHIYIHTPTTTSSRYKIKWRIIKSNHETSLCLQQDVWRMQNSVSIISLNQRSEIMPKCCFWKLETNKIPWKLYWVKGWHCLLFSKLCSWIR